MYRPRRDEPRCRQQIVDRQPEAHGSRDDRPQVGRQRAASQHLADHQNRRRVGRRSRHEQYQRRTGRQPFEHQRRRNRNRSRGTEIHRNREEQHDGHIQQRLVGERGEKVVGHQNRNQPCDEQSQHQPAADVLDHIHESIAQRLHEPAAAATNLAAFRRRKDTVGLAAGQPIDRPPARQRRHERHDGPDHGEGKAQYRVGRHDRIDACLRRGDQKRRHGTLRRPLAPQRHRRGNHAARTQGQRHAEEGSQRHRAEIGLRKVARIEPARDVGVDDSRQQESQQQVGSHRIEQVKKRRYIFHDRCSFKV